MTDAETTLRKIINNADINKVDLSLYIVRFKGVAIHVLYSIYNNREDVIKHIAYLLVSNSLFYNSYVSEAYYRSIGYQSADNFEFYIKVKKIAEELLDNGIITLEKI